MVVESVFFGAVLLCSCVIWLRDVGFVSVGGRLVIVSVLVLYDCGIYGDVDG